MQRIDDRSSLDYVTRTAMPLLHRLDSDLGHVWAGDRRLDSFWTVGFINTGRGTWDATALRTILSHGEAWRSNRRGSRGRNRSGSWHWWGVQR
jgi:hypothetical protein